jgi:putative flippase GtrA
VFGGLSTIVNFVSYYIFARIIGIDEVISSGLSWLCAVIFAYVTNKIFVFNSKTATTKELIKEAVTFVSCRVISGIFCDVGTFAVMVKILKINDIIAKIITQVMVVIVNYIFSKLVIFKKR